MLDEFISDEGLQIAVIEGRGGTGKTTIVKKVLNLHPKKKIVGATIANSAKEVLKKSIPNTTTIAKLLGISENPATQQFEIDEYWDIKSSLIYSSDVLVVDECSMIPKIVYDRLISVVKELNKKDFKIIFMGDNVQLPPIESVEELKEKDSITFNSNTKNYKSKLIERMRQGEDSPIVILSDIVAANVESENPKLRVITNRENNFNPSTNKGLLFKTEEEVIEDFKNDLLKDRKNTKAIVYTNAKKDQINNEARKLLFGQASEFEYNIGENIMALFNNEKAGMFNGEFYTIKSINYVKDLFTFYSFDNKELSLNPINIDGYSLEVENNEGKIIKISSLPKKINLNNKVYTMDEFRKVLSGWKSSLYNNRSILGYDNYKKFYNINNSNLQTFDYGYAITSHKSQGLTLNNAYVYEDDILLGNRSNKTKNQSLYVAITRPKNKTVIVSSKKGNKKISTEELSQYESIDINISAEPKIEEVKPGVSELFESNPELAQIGTPQQYSQYLDTIFPDSKMKDIVYHGSKSKFDKFDKLFLGKNTNPNKSFQQFNDSYLGFHFTSNPDYYRNRHEFGSKYEKNLNEYTVVLNIQNPQNISGQDDFMGTNLQDIGSKDIENNDSVIYDFLSKVDFSKGNKESIYDKNYIVKEPEQIHILGSKKDIEGFKEFVEEKQTSLEPTEIKTEKDVVSLETENQIDELIKLGIIKSKCD